METKDPGTWKWMALGLLALSLAPVWRCGEHVGFNFWQMLWYHSRWGPASMYEVCGQDELDRYIVAWVYDKKPR